MAKAADLGWQTREFDSDFMISRREAIEDFVNQRFVFGYQTTFEPPLFAAAENVERSTAQTAQQRQQAEDREHPRPKAALAEIPCLGVSIAEQWRRQVEM